MKHSFALCTGKASWTAWPGRTAAAALLMVAFVAASAQGPAPSGPGSPPSTAGVHLDIVNGSASYHVMEQFVGINFPNEAVGTTSEVAGTLGIGADGSIEPGSKLSFDLRGLKSDQQMRDGYIQGRTLQTKEYPMAVFIPTKITGLPAKLPLEGQSGFELTGNMTIHGVTKPVTFQGIATFGGDGTIAGRATTSFTFDTFGLTKPSIGRLMDVGNKIDLDIVFKFKRS